MSQSKLLKKLGYLTLLLSIAFHLSGCEEEGLENVAAAQNCLNEMNSSMSKAERQTKAAECRTILGSVSTEEGFIIECSSYFLEEGFFGSKLLEAFDRMDSSDGDSDTLNLLSVFAFETSSNATDAQTACSQTGLTTFDVLGSLAATATVISDAFDGSASALFPSDGSAPDLTEFQNAVADIDSAAEQEALGAAVSSLASSLCSSGDSDFGEDTCGTISSVSSGSSNQVIGACIVECMNNPNLTNCTTDSSISCN